MYVRIAAVLTACGVAFTTSAAQAPPPSIDRFVAAVNATNDDAVGIFITNGLSKKFDEAPPPAVRTYLANLNRVSGGFEIQDVNTPAPDVRLLIVRDRIYAALHAFRFQLDDEQRIIRFEPAALPASAIPERPAGGQAATIVAIGEAFTRGCRQGVFSGAVLVARNDTVLFDSACGEASRRYHIANTVETKFNLGSMSKMFTAVAIMQLIEAGKIRPDDTLDRYLDATWLPPDIARRITIGQLLTHTGGLDDDLLGQRFRDSSRLLYRKVDDYKPLVRTARLIYPPGTGYAYSSTGMVFLGAVIEKASGEDYFDYLRRHVFVPAGMISTDSFDMDDPVENLAMGYAYAPDRPYGWRENTFDHVVRGGPAGGGFSTVGDLFRFSMALQNGVLVSPASLRTLWAVTPQSKDYGAGFMIEQTAVGPVVGHSGLFSGVSSRLDIYPQPGFVVVILSNVESGAPLMRDAIQEQILALTASRPAK